MKRLILLLTLLGLCIAPMTGFSQSWGNKLDNLIGAEEESELTPPTDTRSSYRESTWNIDIEGMSFVMPDQPASDQMISTVTGTGITYKFSDKLAIVGKWMQFDIKGPKDTVWHHDHKLIGFGSRGFFGDDQQWAIDLLSGVSEVSEETLGSVKNLEAPVFLDIKYNWMFGNNLMVGPQITFGRVSNACEDANGTYIECGHGGYTAMSISIQFGLPESWGK